MKQQHALAIMKAGYNVFLTGAAGSGKTHVLNAFIAYLKEHDIAMGVTASTGIAGTHLGGVTVHSWSGIGIKDQLNQWDLDQLSQRESLHRRYVTTEVLIIDEISMLHAHQLDMVDQLARLFRDNHDPFGGMQVVLCGDMFQLPPVGRAGERQMVMDAHVWEQMDLKMCYLTEQYRQSEDDALLTILQEIRNSDITEHSIETLGSRLQAQVASPVQPTKLFTHNTDVDRINNAELAKLDTDSRTYSLTKKGSSKIVASLLKASPVSEMLELKVDAQVMFIKNDPEKKFVNGTRGRVVDFQPGGYPIVETLAGRELVVEPMEWVIEDNGKQLASITQIPLRLAWAITVHKSQGISLDSAEIDLSQAFEPGMGYVALSRVRSLEGLKLVGMNDVALTTHPRIHGFDTTIQELSAEVLDQYDQLIANPIRTITTKPKQSKKTSNRDKTFALLQEEFPVQAIAKKLEFTLPTIIKHVEELVAEGREIDFDRLLPDIDANEDIRGAFDELGTEYLKPVYDYFEGRYPYSYIRLVRAKYFL